MTRANDRPSGANDRSLGTNDGPTGANDRITGRVDRAPEPRIPPRAVAVIGMAGRFPGADSVEELWANLKDGVESIVTLGEEDLRAAGVPEALIGDPAYVRANAALSGADCFDATFFGIHPREAALMDPQHRVLLETAWAALESAGYDPARYPGRIGLFGGLAPNTYHRSIRSLDPDLLDREDEYAVNTAGGQSGAITRVAYKLDLRGPCMNIQTACSTAGVSVHVAGRSLLTGECDMALAGGGRVQAPLGHGYRHVEGGTFSSDGHVRAFDADATGMVRGSGMALVVLKRLEDAIEDRDTIHAVILGTAVNNDGAEKVGFTAPSVQGQSEVIEEALAVAGVSADDIGYVEAHGTGTLVGDPIEVTALTRAFRRSTERRGYCGLGSIKSNIGHLDAGAGAAGLIKAAYALREGVIPPSLHFRTPNPQIDFSRSPFRVIHERTRWERSDGKPRRAGVSSFGIGGTNAHMILEEPPVPTVSAEQDGAGQLLVISARTPGALERATRNLAGHLSRDGAPPLTDAAYTLQTGRRRFSHRRIVVARDHDEAVRLLRSDPPSGDVLTGPSARSDAPVAFMFPGVGSQHPGMARDLYRREPVFREWMDRCLGRLEAGQEREIRALLFDDGPARTGDGPALTGENVSKGGSDGPSLDRPTLAFPSLFATQYALARLLMSWGVVPSAMIGHSVGEYTAACLAGVLDLDDAISIVHFRALLFEKMPAGCMVSVPLSGEDLRALAPDGVSVAVENLPDRSVASGAEADIARLEERLAEGGIAFRRLNVDAAPHSRLLDPYLEEFEAFVAGIDLHPPRIPFVSNVEGDWARDGAVTEPRYWARHLRETVRFSDGIERLFEEPGRILLEVGPGQVLTTLARRHPARENSQVVLPTMRHARESEDDQLVLTRGMGRLWMAGGTLDWDAVHRPRSPRRVPLPTYPFERERHWLTPRTRAAGARAPDLRPDSATRGLDSPTPGLVPAAVGADGAAGGTGAHEERRDAPGEQTGSAEAPELARGGGNGRALSAIREVLSTLSGVPAEELDPERTFLDLGFESLSLTQASASLGNTLGVEVSFRDMIERYPTPRALADHLTPKLTEGGGSRPAEPGRGSGDRSERPRAPTPGRAAPGEDPAASADSMSRQGPWRPIEAGAPGGLTDRQERYIRGLIERLNVRTPESKRLTQEHRRYLADPRSVEGFRRVWKEMVHPIVVERSEGSRLWDVDGNVWVDAAMGFGTILLGHNPPVVREAVEAQLRRGVEIGPQTPLAGEVARRICGLTGVERVAFCNTGSEAVLAGIRSARTVTGRQRVAMFSGSYHGMFDQVLGRGVGRDGIHRTVPTAPGVSRKAVEDLLILDYGDPAAFDVIRAHADELAVILVEPVQSRHPDLQPRAFLAQLQTLARRLDVPLLLDEMITGFRSHPGGVQALWGIEGDIVTYGKVIGGGFPIGVVAGKRRFMDALDGGWWRYGDETVPEVGVTWFAGTFVRHPAALSASRAMLDHLENAGPRLQERLGNRTTRFVERLNRHYEAIGAPLHMEHFSSVFRLDFQGHEEWSSLYYYILRDRGIHITDRRGAFLSTAHSDDDLEQLLSAFQEAAEEMQEAGFLPRERADGMGSAFVQAEAAAAQTRAVASAEPRTTVPDGTDGGVLPLTPAQEEIWLVTRLGDDASASFNLPFELRLEGPLDEAAFRDALRRLVERHDALRLSFLSDGSGQRVRSGASVELGRTDLAELTAEARTHELEALRRSEAETPFDLEVGLPVRARLVRLSPEDHLLQLTCHHLACDGWSSGVMFRELGALYSALVAGSAPELPPAPRYVDYVSHELELGSGERGKQVEAYWLQEFAGELPPLELPTDRPRSRGRDHRAGSASLRLDRELVERVNGTARRADTTVFAFLLGTFETLLHRLTGQDELLVGVTLAGQPRTGAPGLVGHCVSLLPLRSRIGSETLLTGKVSQARGALLDAIDHMPYTLGSLVKHLRTSRDPARPPLISAIFNMDAERRPLHFQGLRAGQTAAPHRFTHPELFFSVTPLADGRADLECRYAAALLDRETVQRWLRLFETLLREAADDPERSTARIPLLPEEERRTLLDDWTDTEADLGPATTLHELLSEAAARFPDPPAVVSGAETFTRPELEARAERLARLLRQEGVGPGGRVGVLLPRTPDLIVALWAVLKAGAAYLPLDPDFPSSRLAFMLDDAEASFVVTEEGLTGVLPRATGVRPILLPGVSQEEREAEPSGGSGAADGPPGHAEERAAEARASVASGPSDPAYVIYTSGSTGRPKGVEVPHRAVVNFLRSMARAPGMTPDDRLLAITTLSFDIAVLELFLPLITGSTTVIADQKSAADPGRLRALLESERITVMQATPAAWRLLVDAGWDGRPSLRVLCGGEALPPELGRELLARSSEVWNLYGPTEATVWCTRHRLTETGGPILIGRPIENVRAYVLDGLQQPVPVGVVGELWVGGEQVATGYVGRPELTEERFLADPFLPGGRMYRTGDLARWRADGRLEALGRRDHQVKVQGFRIELEEIEAGLEAIGEVRQAVAVAHGEAEERRLVCYLRFEEGREMLVDDVRRRLGRTLPSYMIPRQVIPVESFPLTPNGKVDRSALPDPKEAEAPRPVHEPPEGPMEEAIAGMWRELLDVERVGRHDDFFQMGGHSLLATRLSWAIQRELSLDIPVRVLFEATTVASLAERIETLQLLSNQPTGDRLEAIEF